jgi:hypothetical protein
MNNFSVLNLLQGSGARMKQDLHERLTSHPGELGKDREEIIRQFLRHYLPKRFEVSHGFAFDSSGKLSEQLDIVIADSQVCPRFETPGGIRYFPCESIVAVGQVKSALTGRKQLQGALANLESVKSLDRSAKGKAIDISRQEYIDPLSNHLHQIFTFVFVIGQVLDENTMLSEITDHVLQTAVHLWPNVIFACDKYLLTFCCDRGICPNPMDARGIALQKASSDQDILMKLYLLLGMAIETTRVAHLPYWEYLNRITSWSAEVHYSSKEDPPPYLSSLTTA